MLRTSLAALYSQIQSCFGYCLSEEKYRAVRYLLSLHVSALCFGGRVIQLCDHGLIKAIRHGVHSKWEKRSAERKPSSRSVVEIC